MDQILFKKGGYIPLQEKTHSDSLDPETTIRSSLSIDLTPPPNEPILEPPTSTNIPLADYNTLITIPPPPPLPPFKLYKPKQLFHNNNTNKDNISQLNVSPTTKLHKTSLKKTSSKGYKVSWPDQVLTSNTGIPENPTTTTNPNTTSPSSKKQLFEVFEIEYDQLERGTYHHPRHFFREYKTLCLLVFYCGLTTILSIVMIVYLLLHPELFHGGNRDREPQYSGDMESNINPQ